MTDNEVIKALECCCTLNGVGCRNCPQYDIHSAMCVKSLIRNALDLINRQQAEIEGLKKKANTPFAKITFDRDELQEMVDECFKNIEIDINLVKSEAIKEFAERLKENYCFTDRWGKIIPISTVDNLVKEMTEVQE